MRWRFVLLSLLLGAGILASAYWLTPEQGREGFASSALISIAAAFVILVPVYLLERRLAKSVEAINVRVEQVATEFRKTVEKGVNETIQESWKDMQSARKSFRGVEQDNRLERC
jgi:hypothetical protein